MNQPSHDGAYRSAMNAAMNKLGLINDEAIRVGNRMDQLNLVLEALEPFMRSGGQTPVADRRPVQESIDSTPEPMRTKDLTAQMLRIAITQAVTQKMTESEDPIQRRINSALGLAVA